MNEPYLNYKQAAEFLQIAEGTLRNWISSKKSDIPYKKVGHKTFFLESELRVWIDKHSVNKPEVKP